MAVSAKRVQKPELVAVDTQIEHSKKKAKNAATMAERVQNDEERQSGSLNTLQRGADDVAQQMEDARGMCVTLESI